MFCSGFIQHSNPEKVFYSQNTGKQSSHWTCIKHCVLNVKSRADALFECPGLQNISWWTYALLGKQKASQSPLHVTQRWRKTEGRLTWHCCLSSQSGLPDHPIYCSGSNWWISGEQSSKRWGLPPALKACYIRKVFPIGSSSALGSIKLPRLALLRPRVS